MLRNLAHIATGIFLTIFFVLIYTVNIPSTTDQLICWAIDSLRCFRYSFNEERAFALSFIPVLARFSPNFTNELDRLILTSWQVFHKLVKGF